MTWLSAALIHGSLLCAWMTFVVLGSLRHDPRVWTDDAPKPLRELLGPIPPESRRRRAVWAAIMLVGLLGLAARLLIVGVPDTATTFERLLAAYVMFELFNLYDALVLDIGVILWWAPDWAFVPGTKGHPSLRDWRFHVRAYLIGVAAGVGSGTRAQNYNRSRSDYSIRNKVEFKTNVISIRNESQLRNALPSSRSQYLSILKEKGGLNISTVIAGTERFATGGISYDMLEGRCSQATHFVNAARLGAFRFTAVSARDETRRTHGASQSIESKDILSMDGNVGKCDDAAGNGERTLGCSAVIGVNLVPLTGVAPKECTAGRVWGGQGCVCPEGTGWDGNGCVPRVAFARELDATMIRRYGARKEWEGDLIRIAQLQADAIAGKRKGQTREEREAALKKVGIGRHAIVQWEHVNTIDDVLSDEVWDEVQLCRAGYGVAQNDDGTYVVVVVSDDCMSSRGGQARSPISHSSQMPAPSSVSPSKPSAPSGGGALSAASVKQAIDGGYSHHGVQQIARNETLMIGLTALDVDVRKGEYAVRYVRVADETGIVSSILQGVTPPSGGLISVRAGGQPVEVLFIFESALAGMSDSEAREFITSGVRQYLEDATKLNFEHKD